MRYIEQEVTILNGQGEYVTELRQMQHPEDLARIEVIKERLAEIQKYYDDNDYKPHKITRGEWETTDERWLEYLQTCSDIKVEKDALEQELIALEV